MSPKTPGIAWLLLAWLLLTSLSVIAQPDDGDPLDVPVNGPALVLLAAAGVGYVVKKLSNKKSDGAK